VPFFDKRCASYRKMTSSPGSSRDSKGNLVKALVAAREEAPDPFVEGRAMNRAPARLHGAGATFPTDPRCLRSFSPLHARRIRPNIARHGAAMSLRGTIPRNLLALTAIALLVPPAFAQALPKYDAATETKLKGVVEELKFDTPAGGKPVAYLVVKSGDTKTQVFLCPKSFLDDVGATFSPGDDVQITGSKVQQAGAEVILAREVVKSGDTITLRFADGKPAW